MMARQVNVFLIYFILFRGSEKDMFVFEENSEERDVLAVAVSLPLKVFSVNYR